MGPTTQSSIWPIGLFRVAFKGVHDVTFPAAHAPVVDLRALVVEGLIRGFPVIRRVARSSRSRPALNTLFSPFNPFDFARSENPYPGYEKLRGLGPVYFHPTLRSWFVTGHPEAEQVLRASSSVDRTPALTRISPYRDLDPQVWEIVSQLLINTDQPDHTRLRRLVSRAFTPTAMAALEPQVQDVARGLLDSIERQCADTWETEFDAMADYASQLPVYIIGEMLGIPRQVWPRLKELSDTVALLVEPLHGFDPVEMDTAVLELVSIFDVELARRQTEPGNDVLSVLVSAEADGDRLTRSELHSLCLLLLVAGHETTSSLIGNALIALDRDRQSRAKLIGNPGLAAAAVEEFLRFDSPVQSTNRRLIHELTIDGVTIPAGADVNVYLGAANRDTRIHDRPNELLLDRLDPKPLSFGHGIHHCLGAALARLEAKVAIPAFVHRFPTYSVDHANLTYSRSLTLRGPAELPVRLDSISSALARLP
jgi:cytochrome P450